MSGYGVFISEVVHLYNGVLQSAFTTCTTVTAKAEETTYSSVAVWGSSGRAQGHFNTQPGEVWDQIGRQSVS